MERKKVYQTLEDRDNADAIEKNGPCKCSKRNAWLGEGYYFWDTHLNSAHWWGETNYKSYVICESSCTHNKDKCFDLEDNPEHKELLHAIISELEKLGEFKTGKTTLSRVIEFMRGKKFFGFEATRVCGDHVRSSDSRYSKIIKLGDKSGIIDVQKPVQICFYTKNALGLSGYKIIHPKHYVSGD